MRKRPSLTRTFLAYTSLASLIVVLLAGWGLIMRVTVRERRELAELRDRYIKEQEQIVKARTLEARDYVLFKKAQARERLELQIKARTYEAHSTATHIYNTHAKTKSKHEIAKLIHDALFPVSWDGGKGYYFAEDMAGNELINRNNPELEGTNLMSLQDSKGVYIMREILQVAKTKGEGFCSYHWNKPNSPGVLLPKYSFVKRFEPLGWVIGNGKYLLDEEKAIQEEVLRRFETLRIGDGGYIFAATYDGVSLTYPARGRNVLELEDANGKKVVRELIKAAKGGGGFVHYHMPRLGKEKPAPKISYATGIDDWEWYIGYGVYVDHIEKLIEMREAALRKEIWDHAIQLGIFLLLLLLTIVLVTRLLAGKMSNDLSTFANFFRNAARSSSRVPEDRIMFAEFEGMAQDANQMIEEKERAEAQNRALQVDLHRAQKMEAIGLMAGGVAHDLNNVLSGIVNIPELMLRKMKPDDPMRRKVELILDTGLRATAIVSDLLTVGRGISCKKTNVDLTEELDNYLDSNEVTELRRRFPDVKFVRRLCDEPAVVNCSIIHIHKVVLNLLANALEEVESDGTVVLQTSLCHPERPIPGYQEVPAGKYVLLEVSDTGGGISKEDKDRVFEPFYTKKVMGRSGTGLGLSIVWNTMLAHAGYIHLDSDENGTTFGLYFPLTEEAPTHAEGLEESVPAGTGQHVMVVDDEEVQREVARELLLQLGYTCHTVSSGEKAVEWISTHEADVVLLDMILGGGINGLEAYRRILAIKPGQNAIIATGFAETEDVEECLKLGASACLHKPYRIQNLAKALQQALKA